MTSFLHRQRTPFTPKEQSLKWGIQPSLPVKDGQPPTQTAPFQSLIQAQICAGPTTWK
jgi:hypothetical protein